MKKLALGLSVATLVVAILAALLWNDLRAERVQLDELRTRVTAMEDAQSAAVTAAALSAPAVAVASSPDAAASPTSPPAAAPAPTTEERLQKGIADAMTSPAILDMVKEQVRTALAQQFPDLAQELRLTPAETEKLMDLLAKQATDVAGGALGMMGGADTNASDSLRKVFEKQMAGEKEISKTLGSKYPAWQEYQGTVAARQQVNQLRSLLGTGQDALTEAQSRPLIAALGAEQARVTKADQERMSTVMRSSPTANMLEEQLKSITSQNERLTSTASSYLNTNQLNSYKRMLTQQENMLRTMMGASGQGGAPR